MIGGGYYHVLVWPTSRTGEPQLLLWDLSHGRLKSDFLRPYKTGRTVRTPSRDYEPGTIIDVRIMRTSAPLMQVIRAMDRYSKTSAKGDQPVEPWEILHHGTEVTRQYMTEKTDIFGVPKGVALLLSGILVMLLGAIVLL